MHWWRNYIGRSVPGYYQRRREARGGALLGLLGGFSVAYLFSEFVLQAQIHPVHWLAAGVGAVVIYLASYLWLLRRAYTRQLSKQTRR